MPLDSSTNGGKNGSKKKPALPAGGKKTFHVCSGVVVEDDVPVGVTNLYEVMIFVL